MRAPFGDDQHQRSALTVALAQHRREAALSGHAAKESGRPRRASGGDRRSGGVPFVGADENRGNGIAAPRSPQPFERRGVACDPADRGKGLQMLGARVRRRQEQENEVDGPRVDRLVFDRLGEPDEEAIDAGSGPRSWRAESRLRGQSRWSPSCSRSFSAARTRPD